MCKVFYCLSLRILQNSILSQNICWFFSWTWTCVCGFWFSHQALSFCLLLLPPQRLLKKVLAFKLKRCGLCPYLMYIPTILSLCQLRLSKVQPCRSLILILVTDPLNEDYKAWWSFLFHSLLLKEFRQSLQLNTIVRNYAPQEYCVLMPIHSRLLDKF